KTSSGTTGTTMVTIGTVDKRSTDNKSDKQAGPDAPPVVVLPEQQTVNPAPFFLSGGTLTRIPVPSGGLTGAVNVLGPDVSSDGRFVTFFSTSQLPGQGGDSSKSGGDVYLYDRLTNTTTTVAHATGNGTAYEAASISI